MTPSKARQILLITPNAPWPPHTGSAQRSALLHTALSEVGCVRCLCLQNPDNMEPQVKQVLEREYGLVAVARRWGDLSREPWNTLAKWHQPLAARLGNFLGASKYRYAPDKRLIQNLDMPAILKDVDLIVGRYTSSLTCLGLLDGPIPCLIDVDDLDSAALRSQANATNISGFDRWVARRQLANVVQSEPGTLSKATGLWIANPDDKQQPALERAHYLPNIPFYEPAPVELESRQEHSAQAHHTSAPASPIVGVIASFKHHPNVEAVDWFLGNVWEHVLEDVPEAVLNIYGSQISEPLKQRWSEHKRVEVVGFVDNVSTAYSTMSLSICPVLRGAGTNIKVLESAQFNRLCILTTSASRGLTSQAEMKDALVICDTPKAMIEQLAYHLKNPEATRLAAQKLHDAVDKHYSRTAFNKAVHALVEEVS